MVCALLGAQAPRVTDDASLARIKAALRKPAPKLVMNPPKADYRVNIDAIRPFADIFELPPWVTPPDRFAPPNRAISALVDPALPSKTPVVAGGGVDPGAIAQSISRSVRTRRAHAEVMEAILEYCRLHRDEPGAAGICGGPPR